MRHKIINNSLAVMDGDKIVKYIPRTFTKLTLDVMPTGGPNQGRLYTPKPKMGRQKGKRGKS